MTVDILMAVFNGEKYIRNQLISLQAQTYDDWHLWVRDDGSTDKTTAIVDDFAAKDPRITRVNDASSRLGAGKSFFALLRYAKGELVAFCDQDDIWFERKLENLVNRAHDTFDDQTPCLVYCDAHAYDDQRGVITSSSVSHLHASKLGEFLFFNSGYQGCSMLFNRRLAEIARAYDAEFYLHDDVISLIAHAFGKVEFLPRALMFYRQHDQNATGRTSRSLADLLRHFFRRNAYVLSGAHFKEKVEFYKHFRTQLSEEDRGLFEEYLRYPQAGLLKRLIIVLKNGFSLGGHRLPLLAKTLIRRPLE